MALSRLGDYIEIVDNKNSDGMFTAADVKGISTSKVFINTKADLNGVNLSNFKVVNLHEFAYVADTSRRGEKIGLAYADTKPCIISSIYTVFKVKNDVPLLPRYLMMYFCRSEFDRYARFNSWGSARETFSWEDFCAIELEIPSLEIQKKFVAIYEGMLANLKSYERGLDDLKLVLEILFDENKKVNRTKLIEIIKVNNQNNEGFKVDFSCLRGINENCEFTPTRESVKENQVDKYRLISKGSFAINFMCLGNFGKFYLAYNDTTSDVIVSPACNGFDLIRNDVDPYYLVAYLRRDEFQRQCVFYGDGNTRGGINFEDFSSIEIGLPNIKIQKSIGYIYQLFDYRRKTMESLKKRISTMCPILIRGAILESKGGQ